MTGALFCGECGSPLESIAREPTLTLHRGITDQLRAQIDEENEQSAPPTPDDAKLSLFLVDTGDIIALEGLNEYTIGRSSEDQPILPDVDLAPYHGYEFGVSRLHAAIKISTPYAFITDFDSANGTQLNGQKISPNKPYPISHGDVFILGEMKIQLLVNR